MTHFTIAVLVILMGIGLWGALFGGRLPKPYRARPCQGKSWKVAFPNSSADEIREFLALFADAFAFSVQERLKFNPDDRILHVYRALYPGKWMADALELEALSEQIESRYGVRFSDVWREDLSLGELYSKSRREN